MCTNIVQNFTFLANLNMSHVAVGNNFFWMQHAPSDYLLNFPFSMALSKPHIHVTANHFRLVRTMEHF